MKLQKRILQAVVFALQLLALAGMVGNARAQSPGSAAQQGQSERAPSGTEGAATKHVEDAAAVVRRMAAERGMGKLLAQAKGIYIVPTYGRAALGLGAEGGAGVLVIKRPDGTWSDPAFFNIGGISVGVQAGAQGGPIALILMNDKAVDSFKKKNNFSLSADAGLTVISWSRQAQGNATGGDVVAWAGTKGLFGNVAALAVNDIRYNQRANRAYYGKDVTVQDIIAGKATNPHSHIIKQALASVSSAAT